MLDHSNISATVTETGIKMIRQHEKHSQAIHEHTCLWNKRDEIRRRSALISRHRKALEEVPGAGKKVDMT
jgi:hypothetical protein